jgi:hypothetical protein
MVRERGRPNGKGGRGKLTPIQAWGILTQVSMINLADKKITMRRIN